MKNPFDQQYLDVMQRILDKGIRRSNRTGVDTIGLPSSMLVMDLADGFPLLTTKRIAFKTMAVELEGFIKGVTDKRWFQERGCHIWDEWCSPLKVPYGNDAESKAAMASEADLGPIYGAQWRGFGGRDQLAAILADLSASPDSRRMVCSAWNPPEIPTMALPPCHVLWQVLVLGGKLHLNWYQRSADWFLGVPFNMASYSLLAALLAAHAGLARGVVTGFFGDSHLYDNQIAAAREQLSRTEHFPAPDVNVPTASILDWSHDKVEVVGYQYHPSIKVPVVV